MSGSESSGRLGLLGTRLTKLWRLAARPGLWPIAAKGTFPSLEHRSVPFGREFRTVIDVGASRGQFAAFAADRFPEASIICFEPLPDPAASLERALRDRVDLRRVALGAAPGKAEINLSARDDSSSLLPIGQRQTEEFPGTEAVGLVEVDVSTLDREFPEQPGGPCLLKIDVQGFEAEVLKGATRVLSEVDEALIECSFVELYEGQALAPEIEARMSEAGFVEAARSNAVTSRDGEAVQTDILFSRA